MQRVSGMVVVLLGADGSGKSSVIDLMSRALAPHFAQIAIAHLRPAVRSNITGQPPRVFAPHAQEPRGPIASVAKIGYYVASHCVGHLLRVRPVVRRGGLFIFDRYFCDLFVDSKRYRYGGPRWPIALAWRLVPKPDLVILLDAPAEVLQQRKQEVTWEESERQRAAYRVLVERMPNGHIVDASRPLPEVVADIEDIVICHLAQRTTRRLNLENAP